MWIVHFQLVILTSRKVRIHVVQKNNYIVQKLDITKTKIQINICKSYKLCSMYNVYAFESKKRLRQPTHTIA